MKLPTFLIVGVQKAGTTSIYNYLQEHPQVYMSLVKETNFLEQNWEQIEPAKQNKNGIITFEDYCQLFTGVKDEIAVGEVSPNYLFHYQTSAARIERYVPHAQLIIILRNPVERAYSDRLMHLRDGIGDRTLEEQLKNSAHKSFVLRKGFYYTPIKYYCDRFGKDQIKIFLYDDLSEDATAFMQSMYRYIGVDDSFSPDVSQKAQTAKIPKNKAINNLLQRQNPVRTLAANSLKLLLPLEKRQQLRDRLINFNSQSKQQVPLASETRQQLRDFYREDILKLQELIDRDLSAWLE